MNLFSLYNSIRRWLRIRRVYPGDLCIGQTLTADQRYSVRAVIPARRRSRHIAILGKTGSGKTTLLRHFAEQDILSGLGYVFIDLHGQTTEPLLSAIAWDAKQGRARRNVPTVIIDPADRSYSVGLNVLDAGDQQDRSIRAAEIVEVLRARWRLDSFGARTDELMRNSLLLLIESGHTLVELDLVLTEPHFRRQCLARIQSSAVKDYFERRFAALTPQMRAVVIEPVLNKVTAFTGDPHIRHILGQHSTIDLRAALEAGHRVVVNLDKGRLGIHALTLGSLILGHLRHVLFSRRSRRVFTIYCDEIQNLVAFDAGLEDLFAESRKFGVAIVSANQYLDQLTPRMRAALLSVSDLLCFQLSGPDAQRVSYTMGAPGVLAHSLRTLPPRHLISFGPSAEPETVRVPNVPTSRASTAGLRKTSNRLFAKPRDWIEQAILERRQSGKSELDDWE